MAKRYRAGKLDPKIGAQPGVVKAAE